MTTLATIVQFAALGLMGATGPGSFTIESPKQTDRTVLLAWETDQEVRTLRDVVDWQTATPTGTTHRAELAPGEGRQDSTAARVRGAESATQARGCFIHNIKTSQPAGRYNYRLFYRTNKQQQGHARVVIDCYVGDERKYQGLVSKDLAATENWAEVSGSFELPGDVSLIRCLLYQVGVGTSWFDDVEMCRRRSTVNLLGNGGFEGASIWRVSYRKKGESAWKNVDAVVLERFHNVIFLEPDTAYEFLVRRLGPEGKVEAESQVLAASTRPIEPRQWRGLRPGRDIKTPTPSAVYPCVESIGGRLYYSESRGGALWLSEFDDKFAALWTRQWVAPHPVDGRSCYQGQTQMAVLGDNLYISWKRAHGGDAINARQCVASYDTRTGQIGRPFVIQPEDAKDSTWNGGIQAVGQRLWVSYCLWRKTESGYRTTVTVRELDYESGKLGPAFEMSDQPTDTPYTPFLSKFNDELVVCFTDSQSHTDRQPLWLVRFDGRRFHGLMTVSPTGFNQYAKGVQLGDRLLLIWKYGTPYPSHIFGRYMFHDIGMALVDPVGKTTEVTSLIDDVKYNSSPDITLHNGRLVYVYNKFEHLYGSRTDPSKRYGCFVGTIGIGREDAAPK